MARRGFKAWLDVVVTSGTNLPHGASLPFTVLHVTPMDDNRVSACDGTATIVLVCRIILRLAHLSSMFRRISLFEHLFSCAGRSLAFASSRLDEYGYSVRSQTSGKVELCDHARSLRTPFTWN